MTDIVEDFFRLTLKQIKIDENRSDWVTLSLREAVNNAVLHGNKLDPQKKVEVEIEFLEGEVFIRIWDEGEGFDPNSLSDPTKEENLLKPHGRGIFLIKQFVDEVKFFPRNEGFGIELKVNI